MLNNKKIFLILLIVIFVIGTALRFYKLSSYPVGFQMDEASKGYTAYSLLKTGKDDNNHIFPLTIDMFGDNSPAGYHYFAVLPVAIFGLTEFAVRFPGALFGALSILACYFFTYVIFLDKKTGIISALLLAVAPWHINLSRASSESLVALFFIMAGFSLIIWSLRTQAVRHVSIGTVLLALSFLFYQAPRLFVPAFFLLLLIFVLGVWKIDLKNSYKKALIFAFLLLSALVFVLFFIVPGGSGRFSQVNIFKDSHTGLVLSEQIREEGVSGTSVLLTRILHNKAVNYSLAYLSNYLEYFSWNFLFIEGLPSLYFVPNMGVMYLIELPFVLYGVLLLAFQKKKIYKIPLLWLVIAPMAAAIAVDVNNLQRSLVMFPILEIIAAYALVQLFTKVTKQKKQILLALTIVLFLGNMFYFLHQYFVLAKVHRPWYRNNGFSQMMEFVNNDYKNYDHVITTRSEGGYPLFQFYSKYDPKRYQAEGSPKDKSYSGFGKFVFTPDDCPFISSNPLILKKGKIIFIEDGKCPQNKLLHTVKFRYILREDQTKVFRIVYVEDDRIFKNKEFR